MIGLLSNPTKADFSPEGLLPHESAMQTRTRVRTRPRRHPLRPAHAPEAPSQRLDGRRHRLPRTASRLARVAPGWRSQAEQEAPLPRPDR